MCRWEFRSRRAPLSERGRSMRSERETPNGRTWNCRVDILALSERCEEKKSSQNVSGMAEIPVIYVLFFFLNLFLVQCPKVNLGPVTVSRQREKGICGARQTAAGAAAAAAAFMRNRAASSRAAQLHFYATGHRLIFLWLLPSSPTTTTTRYDYFSPCSSAPLYSRSSSSPSPLSFFMPCFLPGQAQRCTFAPCPCNMLRR